MKPSNHEPWTWSPPATIVARRALRYEATTPLDTVMTAKGYWSNCDVRVVATTEWFDPLNFAEIWGRAGGHYVRLARVQMSTFTRDILDGSHQSTIVFRIRGTPCEEWEVRFVNGSTAALPIGDWTMVCWGTESTPEAVAEPPHDAMPNAMVAPPRRAHLMGWDSANGVWRRVAVSAGGALDALAPVYEDNTNGVAAGVSKPLSSNTYAPTVFTNFGTDPDTSVKATAGNVLGLIVHNLSAGIRYAQLHNKASAPAAAEAPMIPGIPIPPGDKLVLGEEFFGVGSGLYFSTGIAFGFSTSAWVYAAGLAADQSHVILYK